jgi:ribose/xylose/arabinose/galactoside ABC-type transport system permease subunit
MGGSGGLLGSLLGVLFLGVLSNGLTLAGISAFWQGVVTGAVLVLAVLFDRFRPDPAR